MQVKCCEHNPCPDRPTWWLRRYQTRPWMCTQCGQWWITKARWAWDGYVYDWKKVEVNKKAETNDKVF